MGPAASASPVPSTRAIRRLDGKSFLFQSGLFLGLLLALANLAPVTIAGITFYQRYISPPLGIHCAYAHALHAESCSAFTKRTLAERGAFRALPLCLERFKACARIGKGDIP
jgi:putative component of membrane protein insertase Oxa1/YidC/SpoIIIJ protein YidD